MPLPDQIDPAVQSRIEDLVRQRGGLVIPKTREGFDPSDLDPQHAERLQHFMAMRAAMRRQGDTRFDEARYMYPQGSDQLGPDELQDVRRRLRGELGLDEAQQSQPEPEPRPQQSRPESEPQPQPRPQPERQEKTSAAHARGVKIAAAEWGHDISMHEAHKIAELYQEKQAHAEKLAKIRAPKMPEMPDMSHLFAGDKSDLIGPGLAAAGGIAMGAGGYQAGKASERRKNPLSRIQDASQKHENEIDKAMKLIEQLRG